MSWIYANKIVTTMVRTMSTIERISKSLISQPSLSQDFPIKQGFLCKQRVTVPLEEGLTATVMATPVDIVYQKRKWFALAKTNEKMIILYKCRLISITAD